MDVDFDLAELDAANNAKASTKFQPKGKPKPKPKPKPKAKPQTQLEPKSTPTPSTQFVEVAATATTDNEHISKNEEEQPKNDANQISGNKNDDSREKSQEVNVESSITLESVDGFLPESTTETVNPPAHSVSPTVHFSMDGDLENGPTESGLINNIDACISLDPLTHDETVISIDNEDFQSNIFSGPKVSKFKPKPKAQTRKVEPIANASDHDQTSAQYEENIHSIPSQTNSMETEHIPSVTIDEIIGSSSIKLTDSVPTEPVELTEIVDSGGRSSKRLKKRSNKTLQLIDEPEPEDEGVDNHVVHEEEQNNNDVDNVPENEKVSVKKGRKSKKSVNEKEKPVRKRKKASEVQGESTKVAKKKFSHSTRRPKRQVNPELLQIPEDELEYHMRNVPMKELIRLAEHRERLAKKEASTLGTPAMNQSSSGFSNHNDEYGGIEQGTNSHDNAMEAENTTYYNYRTYTKITPRMKWSKQDTELFYEAVQQFGTDLSMIKECFPGRTREQIKSKYKKEERQQPLRLNDALTTPSKGLSHFEVVIERLKQAQAEDSENDDPMDFLGENNEDGLSTRDINDDADGTKPVQSEKELKDDVSGKSPIKSDDSEDEMLPWDEYTSEI